MNRTTKITKTWILIFIILGLSILFTHVSSAAGPIPGDDEILVPGSCGDSEINIGEECDDGPSNGPCPMSCSASCIFNSCAAVCGNNLLEAPEVCDNGVSSPTRIRACTAAGGYSGTQSCLAGCAAYGACTTSQNCGDGVMNGPEQCDSGTANNGACPRLCSSTCSLNACPRVFMFNYTIPGIPAVCNAQNLTNTTAAFYKGAPNSTFNVKTNYYSTTIVPITLFDANGTCASNGTLQWYDTFSDGFPETKYFNEIPPFYGLRDNATNGCYKGSCDGGTFKTLKFVNSTNSSGTFHGVNVTYNGQDRTYYCGVEDGICPNDFNWNDGCTFRNATYQSGQICTTTCDADEGVVGNNALEHIERTFPDEESFGSGPLLHEESLACTTTCTPIYSTSSGICNRHNIQDPDCKAQIEMKCGSVIWTNTTTGDDIISPSCVVPSPIPHTYCGSGNTNACVLPYTNPISNITTSECFFNDATEYNRDGWPIVCRGNISTTPKNIWCPARYRLNPVDDTCVLQTNPCEINCTYAKTIGAQIKEVLIANYTGINVSNIGRNATRRMLENWTDYMNYFVNSRRADGNYSCFQSNNVTGKRTHTCALVSIYPVDVYSWEPVVVFYNGSMLPPGPCLTCGSGGGGGGGKIPKDFVAGT
jgi:hypothetical protein